MAEGLHAAVTYRKDLDQLTRMSSADLIEHIQHRYHDVHLQDLPLAIRLAERAEAAHPQCSKSLSAHLRQMLLDLESHQRKEECILFPLLARGASGLLQGPLSRMSVEHAEVLDQIDMLAHLTDEFRNPPDASGRWHTLRALCEKIAAELRTHMLIEEEILFPRGR